MALRKPKPGDKLAYFTKRTIGEKGKVMVWRFEGEELANIEYTCPFCGYQGEKQQKFERIKISIKDESGKRRQVQVFRFQCDNCGKNIDLEKWVKKGPGRRKKA